MPAERRNSGVICVRVRVREASFDGRGSKIPDILGIQIFWSNNEAISILG